MTLSLMYFERLYIHFLKKTLWPIADVVQIAIIRIAFNLRQNVVIFKMFNSVSSVHVLHSTDSRTIHCVKKHRVIV